jgi:pimeloyl-ACP methyl ester carboxylesterase
MWLETRALNRKLLAAALIAVAFVGQTRGVRAGDLPNSYGPLERLSTQDNSGRTINYYVSHPSKPAPIMLLIQGSGCEPVMIRDTRGQVLSSLYSLLPVAAEGRFTVVAVEKPFANASPSGPCSERFNADFTAQSWLAALKAALQSARKLSWVDGRRTLVFGHSEGAVMAALVAGDDPKVTDVVALGMTGESQLFDLVAQAYQNAGSTAGKIQGVDDVYATVADILERPNSATDMAWGHPYRRWSSFFRASPVDALLNSRARIYIASGTDDRSVPILSTELAIAKLTLAGRDLTVRRVADADHSLSVEQNGEWKGTETEYYRAREWFWRAKPEKRP